MNITHVEVLDTPIVADLFAEIEKNGVGTPNQERVLRLHLPPEALAYLEADPKVGLAGASLWGADLRTDALPCMIVAVGTQGSLATLTYLKIVMPEPPVPTPPTCRVRLALEVTRLARGTASCVRMSSVTFARVRRWGREYLLVSPTGSYQYIPHQLSLELDNGVPDDALHFDFGDEVYEVPLA